MADKEEYSSVTLHIICQDAPYKLGEFGLQDKAKQLHPPIAQTVDAWEFEAVVRVVKNEKTGAPNFLGDFAHGTSDERFLYLSLRQNGGATDAWIRRIKIPLKLITWEQILQLGQPDYQKLSVAINAAASGTVKNALWQLSIE